MPRSPFHIYTKTREFAEWIGGDNRLLAAYASADIKVFPYQVAAAMFALRSLYLKGVILADEGSLGKTYEALLVASQKWFEGKTRQLLILPGNLVEQWVKKIEKVFTIPYTV
jgi:SNF2 family DNA or RNA helicase